jgi:hypothetical protein
MIQVSMNYNASVYGNAVEPLKKKYNISHELAVVGQAVFLIAYGKVTWNRVVGTTANKEKLLAANYGHLGAKNSVEGKFSS